MVVLCIHRKYYMPPPMSIAKLAANTGRGAQSPAYQNDTWTEVAALTPVSSARWVALRPLPRASHCSGALQKVHVSSSGKNFTELGMLAVVNRKAEQGILAPGAIGKMGAIDMQSLHGYQNDSIALR